MTEIYIKDVTNINGIEKDYPTDAEYNRPTTDMSHKIYICWHRFLFVRNTFRNTSYRTRHDTEHAR